MRSNPGPSDSLQPKAFGKINRPCPYLPPAEAGMTHRCLSELDPNSAAFYVTALRYGNFLWQSGHAGRAILALTRALYADLPPQEPVYTEWPLPYEGLAWILRHQPNNHFPGNPRISFQHQATRICGPRRERLRARAWAVWALVRAAKPDLPGDELHPVIEPDHALIFHQLQQHGHSNEADQWTKVLDRLLDHH